MVYARTREVVSIAARGEAGCTVTLGNGAVFLCDADADEMFCVVRENEEG